MSKPPALHVDRLKAAIEQSGLSQTEIARQSGIHRNTLRSWIVNEREPRVYQLLAVCKVLDTTIEYLYSFA